MSDTHTRRDLPKQQLQRIWVRQLLRDWQVSCDRVAITPAVDACAAVVYRAVVFSGHAKTSVKSLDFDGSRVACHAGV